MSSLSIAAASAVSLAEMPPASCVDSAIDTFVYLSTKDSGVGKAARDTITDFNAAQGDKIGLVGLDAKASTSTNDAFTFIGNQAFHGVAGELRYVLAGDGIDVLGDTNGDRVADIAIHMTGLTSITSSSFTL